MFLDLGFVLGNSHKHLCNTVADVVLHHITDKKHSHKHTYARIDEVENAILHSVEPRGQRMVDEFDGGLEKYCCKTAAYADKKRQDYHHVTLGHLLEETSQR